jgi:alpha-ketoglutarate-dependent taurine dioxygenase
MKAKLSIERLTTALGAEVRGMSLRGVVAEQVETIKSLLLEHQVLFFPEQFLDIDAHSTPTPTSRIRSRSTRRCSNWPRATAASLTNGTVTFRLAPSRR